FSYFPPTTRVSHSTREKLTRHRSWSFGGTAPPLSSFSPVHGQRISTVQPPSLSCGSLRVPSIQTADFRPVISHELMALPSSLYGLSKRRSQVVWSAFSSSSAYGWLSPSGSRNTSKSGS